MVYLKFSSLSSLARLTIGLSNLIFSVTILIYFLTGTVL